MDRFSMNENTFNREVKRFIDIIHKEYNRKLTIDIDKHPDSIGIDLDGRYIMDVHDKVELIAAVRAVYGTLVAMEHGE